MALRKLPALNGTLLAVSQEGRASLMNPDVTLRPLREGDLDTLCRWRNHPEVCRFLSDRVKTLDEATVWHHRVTGDPNNLLLGITADAVLVGYGIVENVNLHSGKCEIGIVIGEPGLWGKGIGRTTVTALLEHCFGKLQLHRVLAVIARGNGRAVALFEHMSFTHEGTLREATLIDGKHMDLLLYSLLKREYQDSHAR
jgi:RimJ/RimL family protein N-acetyltransferase